MKFIEKWLQRDPDREPFHPSVSKILQVYKQKSKDFMQNDKLKREFFQKAKNTLLRSENLVEFKHKTSQERFLMSKSLPKTLRQYNNSAFSPLIVIEARVPAKFQRQCCPKHDDTIVVSKQDIERISKDAIRKVAKLQSKHIDKMLEIEKQK